ncbi:copper chaperone PCu(A)C [Novosphingobium sp. RD2P27]|uniref:Copper chaperone PCu(A)C n=1 Tax=Novosphingobium kalidii TaxID=3230299 RepID=A0ABV2D2I8_9SPHN
MTTLRSLMLAGLVATAVNLSACDSPEPPAAEETAVPMATSASIGPSAKPGVNAAEGRLVLPVIAGRPGVVYFKATNNNEAAVSLAAVHVEGVGKAEMHRTEGGKMAAVDRVEIAPKAEIAFEPGGLHVMAFEVDNSLQPGGSTEMTLTFADGDKLSMPIKVETMGASTEAAR